MCSKPNELWNDDLLQTDFFQDLNVFDKLLEKLSFLEHKLYWAETQTSAPTLLWNYSLLMSCNQFLIDCFLLQNPQFHNQKHENTWKHSQNNKPLENTKNVQHKNTWKKANFAKICVNSKADKNTKT